MKSEEITYSKQYISMSREELIGIMNNALSRRRFKHVLRVEETALALAELYNADLEKVSIAALTHDFAKERPDEEMRDLIISENLDLDMLQFGSNIWHGPIGAVLMKNQYKIDNEEILEAIRCHTIGSPLMGKVAQIIYVADFIEPNRSFNGVEKARKLSSKDLHETIAYIALHTLKHLLKRQSRIYPKAIETYNAWVVSQKEEYNDTVIN